MIRLALAAVVAALALAFAGGPAFAVKDGPGCGSGIGVPGKPPIIRIDC